MTTNVQLNQLVKELGIKNFKGCLMKDELSGISPQETECFIINLQNHNQGGSHWCAVWKVKGLIYYFDSYGAPIPLEVRDYFNHQKICNFQSFDKKYPDQPIQKFNQTWCGQVAVLFLLLCEKGFTFEKIIKLLE